MIRKKKWNLDFAKIAAGFAITKPFEGQGEINTSRTRALREQWRTDVLAIADVLEANRRNFDRERFLIAAGYIPKEGVSTITSDGVLSSSIPNYEGLNA